MVSANSLHLIGKSTGKKKLFFFDIATLIGNHFFKSPNASAVYIFEYYYKIVFHDVTLPLK